MSLDAAIAEIVRREVQAATQPLLERIEQLEGRGHADPWPEDMSLSQATRLARVDKSELRAAIEAGDLHAVRIRGRGPDGTRWAIQPDDLRRWQQIRRLRAQYVGAA